MKECYIKKRFGPVPMGLIEVVDRVMGEYAADGYDLTLRQVYYCIISHCDELIPDDRRCVRVQGRWIRDPNGSKNADPNYKWIGDIINDARLSGLLDWDVMVDRTRMLQHVSHWEGPGDIVDAATRSFRLDTRVGQPEYADREEAPEGCQLEAITKE